MPNVDIPGVGVVAFPETMPADSINAVARRLYVSNAAPTSPSGHAPYSGTPDEPGGMSPGLLDPLDWAGSLFGIPPTARAGSAVAEAVPGAINAAKTAIGSAAQAGGPLARGAGGALLEAGLEGALGRIPGGQIVARGLMSMMRGGGQAAAKAAPTAAETIAKELGVPAEQVAEHLAQPLQGAEGQLFRQGGMGAVVRERIAKAAESAAGITPATAAAPATSGAANFAKDFGDYARARGFAILKQAGLPDDAASLSKMVGREIKSRTELTPEDWEKIHNVVIDHLKSQTAQKAAASFVNKAGNAAGKVAGEIVPNPAVKRIANAQSFEEAVKYRPWLKNKVGGQ